MKIVGVNRFNSKKGDSWLVLYGVQKFNFPEGKKGYETCEHWIKNPASPLYDKAVLGASVEVLYKKEGNSQIAFDIVESEDDIDLSF